VGLELNCIQASRLQVTRNTNPRTPPPSSSLVFGRTFVSVVFFFSLPFSVCIASVGLVDCLMMMID
jgi:hypothetical protein